MGGSGLGSKGAWAAALQSGVLGRGREQVNEQWCHFPARAKPAGLAVVESDQVGRKRVRCRAESPKQSQGAEKPKRWGGGEGAQRVVNACF